MTSIQGRGRFCRERTSETLLGSSSPPEFSYDKTPANSPAVELLVAKYIEKDLQRILKMILEAWAPPSDTFCEKPLKARSSDIYCGKSHIECYNFCQQCEDHFATARAKSPNHISFAIFFLRDRINFCWQQYKRKNEAETQSLSPERSSKPFFVKA